jgi:hypothetical protein
MNTQTEKVFLNENLLKIIISYLSINDIINFTSSNKKIKENNDKIYNEICKKIYTSSYDEYSIINPLIENNNQRKNEELNYEAFLNSRFKWRNFYICGNKIKYLYNNLYIEKMPSFKRDTNILFEQLFSVLKGKLYII